MADNDTTNFKFNYIVWMTDQEILKLLGAIPKKDQTNLMGHLEIKTISLACKMSNEVIMKRICQSLSSVDRAEFLAVSKCLNNCEIEEILEARRTIERTADQLEIEGEIGGWWQKYTA